MGVCGWDLEWSLWIKKAHVKRTKVLQQQQRWVWGVLFFKETPLNIHYKVVLSSPSSLPQFPPPIPACNLIHSHHSRGLLPSSIRYWCLSVKETIVLVVKQFPSVVHAWCLVPSGFWIYGLPSKHHSFVTVKCLFMHYI